jgi:hypothetical protein
MSKADAETQQSKMALAFMIEEYKALQTEIIQRYTQGYLISGVGAAGIIGLITVMNSPVFSPNHIKWQTGWFLIFAWVGILAFLFTMISRDTFLCCDRIKEIEQYVTKFVGSPDPNFPISWQTRFGIRVRSPRLGKILDLITPNRR